MNDSAGAQADGRAAMTDPAVSTGRRKGRAAAPRQVATASAAAADVPAPGAAASEALFGQIIEAAAEVGADGKGAGGLKGYLRTIAQEDRKSYFGVLARLILRDAPTGQADTVTRIERVIVKALE
jgi:hypothetical protein